MVTREAETGRSTLLYKILLYVYAGRSLFCGTVQALTWKDLRESSKAVGWDCLSSGWDWDCLCSDWDSTWIPPRIQAKASSCEAIYCLAFCVILLLCYKVLRLGAAAESRRTGFFLHSE
jgi:hypothetical protein